MKTTNTEVCGVYQMFKVNCLADIKSIIKKNPVCDEGSVRVTWTDEYGAQYCAETCDLQHLPRSAPAWYDVEIVIAHELGRHEGLCQARGTKRGSHFSDIVVRYISPDGE